MQKTAKTSRFKREFAKLTLADSRPWWVGILECYGQKTQRMDANRLDGSDLLRDGDSTRVKSFQ